MLCSVRNLRAKSLTDSFQFYFLSGLVPLEGYLSPDSGQQDFAQRKRVCVVREAHRFPFQYNSTNVSGLEVELFVFVNVLVFSLFF